MTVLPPAAVESRFMSDDNRRKHDRVALALRVRVQGYLASGSIWEELSTTLDVSLRGASFPLTHPVELGHVLRLTLALPKRLRSHDLNDTTYTVYTLVRFVHQASEPGRVGVLFFGKYPPRGFHEHPDGRYLLPGDAMPKRGPKPSPATPTTAAPVVAPAVEREPPAAPASAPSPATAAETAARPGIPPAPVPGAPTPAFLPSGGPGTERRGAPRVDVFLNFVLQKTDATGTVLQQELTVADNVSRGGVRVMTTLALQVGDVVLLQEAGGTFATRAEIRDITHVPACQRLHLRFLDSEAPDRLLR